MPSPNASFPQPISSSLALATQALVGSVRVVTPSQGIPSKSSDNASLSTWTVIKIYPDGKKRNRGIVRGSSTSAITWVLPLPVDLSETNSLSYENNEFGAIEQSLQALLPGGETVRGDAFDAISGSFSSILSGALNALGAEGVETVKSAVTRSAANPATESLFKAPNLRTFSFSWNLIPLTQQDAEQIEKFRKEILYYIYPRVGGIGGANRLDYPAEFEVTFYAKGKNGQVEIFSTFPAACTEFTLNYGVQGVYGIHEDGRPTQTTINATFQEIYSLVQGDWPSPS